jgi:hypothetical protein
MTAGELKSLLRDVSDEAMVLLVFSDPEYITYCSDVDACAARNPSAPGYTHFTISSDLTTGMKMRGMYGSLPEVASAPQTVAATAPPVPESRALAVIDSKGNPGAIIHR